MNLEEFCDRFQVLQDQGSGAPELGDGGRQLLRGFLQDPCWLGDFLQKYIAGPAFLSDQPFRRDEIVLHIDDDERGVSGRNLLQQPVQRFDVCNAGG